MKGTNHEEIHAGIVDRRELWEERRQGRVKLYHRYHLMLLIWFQWKPTCLPTLLCLSLFLYTVMSLSLYKTPEHYKFAQIDWAGLYEIAHEVFLSCEDTFLSEMICLTSCLRKENRKFKDTEIHDAYWEKKLSWVLHIKVILTQ
jgi:hypothetical protein